MGLNGDEWHIPIPELAERMGQAQHSVVQLGRYGRQSDVTALKAILDARVQLEAAERLGVAAVRADEAAVAAAAATERAADSAASSAKATRWLVWVTVGLVLIA